MNTDSKEFTAILSRVPKWHMLTPGKDRWEENDKVPGPAGISLNVCSEDIDAVSDCWSMREIPEHVRRSEAWWALYNRLATVAPIPRFDQAHSQFIVTLYADHSGDDNPSAVLDVEEESQFNGLRGFNGSAEAYSQGSRLRSGDNKNLQEGPGTYMRWVLGV